MLHLICLSLSGDGLSQNCYATVGGGSKVIVADHYKGEGRVKKSN